VCRCLISFSKELVAVLVPELTPVADTEVAEELVDEPEVNVEDADEDVADADVEDDEVGDCVVEDEDVDVEEAA
jgi:hypothetical protein